jgi:gas vesicle protein
MYMNKKAILAAIAAATVGAAFGVLCAPARGEVTRKKLGAQLDIAKAKVMEGAARIRKAAAR